jgi:protein O-GlcNAc transferase
MSVPESGSLLRLAQAALSQGQPQQAAAFCRQILSHDALNAQARYFLALTHALNGEIDAAIGQWEQVLRINPRDFATLANLGSALSQEGRHTEAIARLRKALVIDASQAQVHYNLGNSLLATNELEAAIRSFQAAVARNPRFTEGRNNLGVAYRRAGRLADARTEFAAAVAANPEYADAHGNLGATLQAEGQLEAAVPHLLRALSLDVHCTDAALSLSQTLQLLGRADEAVGVLAGAAARNPDTVEVHYALGVAQHRAGRIEAAMSCYDRVVALRPGLAAAWRDRGRALERLQRLAEALESYQRAAALAPGDLGAIAGALSSSVRTCEWTLAAQSLQQLRESPAGLEAIHPFLALSVCDDPAEQLQIGAARCRSSVSAEAAASPPSSSPSQVRRHDARIRIAYVSSDLRDHAVAYLIAGILERHDRDLFEIHTVSLQPEAQKSEIGQRLRQAVDHCHDASTLTDAAVAEVLRDLAIDIAVDLNGYTIGGRQGIFAHRAAPVQVSYLGYAGTLGAPYMDYLVADHVVIPHGEERWYSEQVVRLPHCYLPNDDRRVIGARATRSEAGLPEDGLVFCAFTNAYKINPPVYEIWMRLLREVHGSVLWLRGTGSEARGNLLREAQSRGVDAERLIFASHVPSVADHLGRQALADLFLDTLPYNAHSTTCDALWAGVPVLTCTGSSFAARVAASALTAMGLPELITHSLKDYERNALELAHAPERLRALRARLEQQRTSAPLFDTATYCRHLESAYRTMHERALHGERPSGFTVGN